MQGEEDGQWTGSSDEDTMEEELYECKVEVKQQNTLVSSTTLYNVNSDRNSSTIVFESPNARH